MPSFFQTTRVTLAAEGSSARSIREILFATELVPAQEAGDVGGAGNGSRYRNTHP